MQAATASGEVINCHTAARGAATVKDFSIFIAGNYTTWHGFYYIPAQTYNVYFSCDRCDDFTPGSLIPEQICFVFVIYYLVILTLFIYNYLVFLTISSYYPLFLTGAANHETFH